MVDDEAGTSLVGEVGPDPLEGDENLVAEAHEFDDVDEEPC